MSDPYQEATRHERTGLSTVAKVFLIGGGLLAAVVIAFVIWASVTVDRMVEDIVESVEEMSLEVSPEVIATGTIAMDALTMQVFEHPQGAVRPGQSVAPKLGSAMASALDATLKEHGFSATPGEGSGLAFNFEPPDGNAFGMSFPSATGILDKVALGQARFADVNKGAAAESGKMPDWVPIHPGARHSGSGFYAHADFSFGVTVLVANAGAHDVLDWYREAADRAGLDRVSMVVTSARETADGEQVASRLDVHRFAAMSEDRSLTVLVTEDDHGDSLFVVIYKGDGRTG